MTTYKNESTLENYTNFWYDSVGNKVRMYTGLSTPLIINGLDNLAQGTDIYYSITKYSYDSFNRLQIMTDPLNKQEVYNYDLNNNLTNKIDRNGNSTVMTYDGLNRLLTSTVTTDDGSGNSTLSYRYTLTGNKLSISKSENGVATSSNYLYDDLGRLIKETEGTTITKEYDYDATNNRKSFVLKQNNNTKTNTSYIYDKLNRLKTVSEDGVLNVTYNYDDNGNRANLSYNANGNSTYYEYNLANKLNKLTNKKSTTTVSEYSYTYYLDGNQASKKDQTGKVTNYTYDGLGRLTSESPTGEAAVSYTYDDSNNRNKMTLTGVSSTSYKYDLNNRLQNEIKTIGSINETTIYMYDNNGNEIYKTVETTKPINAADMETIGLYVSGQNGTDNSTNISRYNGFNQLISTTLGDKTIAYAYNAEGLRTSKTVNNVTTSHIWDGQEIALELNGSGAVTNKYVRGINLIYSEDGAGVNRRYYVYNGHGDVVQLTDTTGSAIKTYDYDAFGNEKNPDPNDTNVFRYCGEYFDKETGTIYLRARYYDPSIGRFITEDSDEGKINDPLSLNLYTYCRDNPIMYSDFDGHSPHQLNQQEDIGGCGSEGPFAESWAKVWNEQVVENESKINNGKTDIKINNGKTYTVNGKILTENQFSALRQKAVDQAWKQEQELIKKTGNGTREWTAAEKQELLQSGRVKGYEGQHMKSAKAYPDYAGNPDNIQFLKGRTMDINEHFQAHGGSYTYPTNHYWDPFTGNTIEFDNYVPGK